MNKSIFLSVIFHIIIISLTAISFPYMIKKPIDLPPIISIELIQISDFTNVPYAPKAKKILEKIKKEKERVVSEQAPPKMVKKEELQQKYINLNNEHQNLKHKLEKVNLEAIKKFENQNKFTQKVDELNQETDSLIEEIDKWQT